MSGLPSVLGLEKTRLSDTHSWRHLGSSYLLQRLVLVTPVMWNRLHRTSCKVPCLQHSRILCVILLCALLRRVPKLTLSETYHGMVHTMSRTMVSISFPKTHSTTFHRMINVSFRVTFHATYSSMFQMTHLAPQITFHPTFQGTSRTTFRTTFRTTARVMSRVMSRMTFYTTSRTTSLMTGSRTTFLRVTSWMDRD